MHSKHAALALASLVVVGSIGLSSAAFAQDKASTSPLHDVKRLVGKWNGTGTMKTEGKTYNVKATWDCADAAGGSGVRCHMSITGLPGGFTYVVDDLWGHSAGDGLVHWYAVTNGGEVHDHRGHFGSNGGALEFDGPMRQDLQRGRALQAVRQQGLHRRRMHAGRRAVRSRDARLRAVSRT
jgi:hypothetical protein